MEPAQGHERHVTLILFCVAVDHTLLFQVSHIVFRVFNLLVPMSSLKPFMYLQAK